MIIQMIINSLFVTFGFLIHVSLAATVSVEHKGVLFVPVNRRTSTLKVSLNETVQDSNVTILCDVQESVKGASQVVFTNTTALVGENRTTVPFRIVSPGQPVTVQCSAQSQGNIPQFNFATSKGQTGSLQVTQGPTVSICNNPVLVTSDSGCQTLQVELSEVVSGSFPVVVNCSVVNDNGGPKFQFEATVIDIGKKTAKVPFVTASKGTTTKSAQVVCRAQTYKVLKLSSWFLCGQNATPTTVAPPITAAPSNITSNTTATTVVPPITFPTPSPPPVINITRFNTTVLGVDYFQYLEENSAGSPVTFTFNPLALQLYPPSASIRGAYSVIIALNSPTAVPVDIECSLTLVPSGQINTSAINCPQEPVGSVTLTSSSTQLKLGQTETQFKRSEVSKTLIISIDGIPSSPLSDLVRLSCCPKTTAILKPTSVVGYLWVDLQRFQPVNSASGSKLTSTSSLDIDLTCPCDLKENQCDTGCCCDQDCSSSERSTFSCMKGFFGGDSEERPFEFSCQATWPDLTDLHPVLCVTTSNSPFIGYWYNYTSPHTAKDVPEYKTLLQSASNKKRFSYQLATKSQSSTDGIYKLGTSIKTAANSNDNKYLSATMATLSLPNKVFSGLCSQSVPVRFWESSESVCVTEISESLCSSSSSLSASSYLMSREITSPPCPVPAAVLRGGTFSQNQNEQPDLADLEVQYFCTADSSLRTSPWRCAFDDGKTAPPLPFLNQTSKVCSNVVLNVTYRFDTFEQKINKVEVMVTIGNVKIPAQSTSTIATSESPIDAITQVFRTKFVRLSSSNSSNASGPAVTRSGNPGYVRGLPVLAVTRSGSNSTLIKLYVRSPSGDSLCSSSTSAPMLYGETSNTGCLLKLGIEDMKNCSRVRKLAIANHEAFLKATHVGRTGNSRATIDEDWLPIIRDKLKEPPLNPNTTFTGVCSDIPYGLLIQVLVSEAGRYKGVPQMEIVGLKIGFKYSTWQFQCVSGYSLSCLATPNQGVNVTPTNTSSVTPNATISASVTVSPSVNGSSAGQSNGSTSTSSGNHSNTYSPRQIYFSLESNVVFIEVPATEPAKVKRSLDQSGICHEDVCKEELFYPLSPAYQGESKEQVMTYFVLLLFVALVTFSFTKPWG